MPVIDRVTNKKSSIETTGGMNFSCSAKSFSSDEVWNWIRSVVIADSEDEFLGFTAGGIDGGGAGVNKGDVAGSDIGRTAGDGGRAGVATVGLAGVVAKGVCN